MNKQLLFLSLAAAALFAGCAKETGVPSVDNALTTEITAQSFSRGSIDTKAPISGSTLDGKQADVYTTASPLHTYVGDKKTMLTDAYARGTMTFNAAQYVGYDPGFTGNSLLPGDGSVRYMYGFYPTGWTRAVDATNTFETLSFTFDGSHDVMSSWVTGDLDVQIKYNDATLPERGDFTFKHLLMRCDVQVQAKDATAVTNWGRVKSVELKDATINKVSTTEPFGYAYAAGGGGTTSFFKMGGTDAARTYVDDAFGQTAFADMLPLTIDVQNACYSMIAPVVVDADLKTAEFTLVVVTLDKDAGTEVTTEVPVSLDRNRFPADANGLNQGHTRGYAVTVQLSFRAGAIQAMASVELWKDGGQQDENVDGDTPVPAPAVGDYYYADGTFATELTAGKTATGMIYYVDPADPQKYKVMSLEEAPPTLTWAAADSYEVAGAQSFADGKANSAAVRAYFEANPGEVGADYAVAFPPFDYCYNYKGTSGSDAVGTWYVPAVDEVQYLWCAYNGKAPVTWAGPGTSAAAPADAAKQTAWNDRITAAGIADEITSSPFWSSTEDSDNASSVWEVNFSLDGDTGSYAKSGTYYVRCVREL